VHPDFDTSTLERLVGILERASAVFGLGPATRIYLASCLPTTNALLITSRFPQCPFLDPWGDRSSEGYADGFLFGVADRGSASSTACARCHTASRSRRSRVTSALAVSRIASA